MTGLQADVSEVLMSDIVGTVDLAAYMEKEDINSLEPGEYTVEATFELGEEITIVEPVKVKIIVQEAEEE